MNINNFVVSEISEKYDVSTFLIASYLFLIPFGRLSAVPMAVMALLGIRLIFGRKIVFKQPGFLFFSLVFLCFWVPILCSLPDAINVAKTAKVAGVYLHLWLAGLYVIHILSSDPSRQDKLLKICALIILFWVLDALFQAIIGYDIFGFHPGLGALNGPFGSDHPKMGIYLSALCPILFVYAGRNWGVPVHLIIIAGTSLTIFLAGRRGGWIMLAVVLISYVTWLVWGEKNLRLRWVLVLGILICCVFFSAYYTSSPFKARVEQSLLVFDNDLKSVDIAISKRLPIWRVAVRIIEAQPINGVGARNFRYAYRTYADDDDIFIQDPSSLGAYYTHQILLDIGSGTGFIGLLGFVVFCWLLISRWLKSAFVDKQVALAYGLALLAVFFPLNTHYATYSSHWSSFVFWLLALFLSGSCPNE